MDRPLTANKRRQLKFNQFKKLSLFFIGVVGCLYWLNNLLTPSMNLSAIRTATVALGTIKATINAGGVVVPIFEETLTSEIDAQVAKVQVKVGQYVNEGQIILELNSQAVDRDIDNITEQIAIKDNQIESEKLNLEKSLNELSGRMALIAVDLESRKSRAERIEQLSGIGAISAQDLLEAKLNVKRTQIELDQLEQAKTDLSQASNSKRQGLILEKSLLKTELAEKKRVKESAIVKAPRAGIVTYLLAEEGASVNARLPVAKIADAKRFRIEASLSDFYAQQLRPEMTAEIRVNDQVIEGYLETHTPSITNGVMTLPIALNQPENALLYHNLRVDVNLITQVAENVLTIDKGPFVNGRGIQEVFVVHNQQAVKRKVAIGLSSFDRFEVEQGLEAGERVIISDVSDLLHLQAFKLN